MNPFFFGRIPNDYLCIAAQRQESLSRLWSIFKNQQRIYGNHRREISCFLALKLWSKIFIKRNSPMWLKQLTHFITLSLWERLILSDFNIEFINYSYGCSREKRLNTHLVSSPPQISLRIKGFLFKDVNPQGQKE